MENKEMEDIREKIKRKFPNIKKKKLEKIIKEVKWEFPDDILLQEIHIVRRVLDEEAKERRKIMKKIMNNE